MPEGAVMEKKKSILFPDSDCREGLGDRYSIPVICILTEIWRQITHQTFKVIYDCEQTKTIEAHLQYPAWFIQKSHIYPFNRAWKQSSCVYSASPKHFTLAFL